MTAIQAATEGIQQLQAKAELSEQLAKGYRQALQDIVALPRGHNRDEQAKLYYDAREIVWDALSTGSKR